MNCKYYDKANGWCEKLSDFGYPKRIEYCPKSPCEYAKPIEQTMTDNDIIKALGYCFAVGDCEHCIYADKPCQELMADALDLINRQKAEIERLAGYNENLQTANTALSNEILDIKSEAIREFAERLKAEVETPISINIAVNGVYKSIPNIIEDLVKEMTEGEDEKR